MWAVRWTIDFESLSGRDFQIAIYDDGYNGNPTPLIGSDDVFTTQEKCSDIFTPVLVQTGYIRIIVDSLSTVDELIPNTYTERFVRLYEGNSIKWQGFLQPSNYTQPFLEYKWKVEIPVISVLGVLKYISVPFTCNETFYFNDNLPVNTIFNIVRDSVFGSNINNPIQFNFGLFVNRWQTVNTALIVNYPTSAEKGNATIVNNQQWYNIFVNMNNVFCIKNTENKTEYSITKSRIENAYKVIEEIVKIFGLCIFEDGDTIYVKKRIYAKADESIALTPQYMGNNNKVEFISPANSVSVTSSISSEVAELMSLPLYYNTDDLILKMPEGYDIVQCIQLQTPGRISDESYHYYWCQAPNMTLILEESNFNDAYNYWKSNAFYIYAGAAPCVYKEKDEEEYESGLFAVCPNTAKLSGVHTEYIWSKRVTLPKNSAFLNLYFELITQYAFALDLIIKSGDEYYHGGSWSTTPTIERIPFTIEGKITDPWYLNGTGKAGVRLDIRGKEEIEIMLQGIHGNYENTMLYSVIIKEFSVNTYSQLMGNNIEFKKANNTIEEFISTENTVSKSISTKLSTNNGVPYAPNFLTVKSNDILFFVAKAYINNEYIRLEEYLFLALKSYYSKKRMMMTLKCRDMLDKTKFYTYQNKYFIGTDQTHEWWMDRQTIKFIETLPPYNLNN